MCVCVCVCAGNLCVETHPLTWGMPTWQWVYTMTDSGQIQLLFVSGAGAGAAAAAATAANTVVLPSLANTPPPPLISPLMTGATPLGHMVTRQPPTSTNGTSPPTANGHVGTGVGPATQGGPQSTTVVVVTPEEGAVEGSRVASHQVGSKEPVGSHRRTPQGASRGTGERGEEDASWTMLQKLNAIESDVDFSI